MHFDTKKLTRCALVAAIYVALTMLSNALNLAYGPIQLRFSEAMTVLPFLMPEASWGLFIGCVLSNILSPYGPLDMIVGSAATLLAALLPARCRNIVSIARHIQIRGQRRSLRIPQRVPPAHRAKPDVIVVGRCEDLPCVDGLGAAGIHVPDHVGIWRAVSVRAQRAARSERRGRK